MILNDTLQKHKECIELCDLEETACELEQENKAICESEKNICERNCDFDYGP